MKFSNNERLALAELKKHTRSLVRASRRAGRVSEYEEGDLIDKSIIDSVEGINANPDLTTTGSCSGHDGYPFLSLFFVDSKTRDKYIGKLRREGYRVVASDDYRMTVFSDNLPNFKVREEWNVYPSTGSRRCTWKQAMNHWQKWKRILKKEDEEG